MYQPSGMFEHGRVFAPTQFQHISGPQRNGRGSSRRGVSPPLPCRWLYTCTWLLICILLSFPSGRAWRSVGSARRRHLLCPGRNHRRRVIIALSRRSALSCRFAGQTTCCVFPLYWCRGPCVWSRIKFNQWSTICEISVKLCTNWVRSPTHEPVEVVRSFSSKKLKMPVNSSKRVKIFEKLFKYRNW